MFLLFIVTVVEYNRVQFLISDSVAQFVLGTLFLTTSSSLILRASSQQKCRMKVYVAELYLKLYLLRARRPLEVGTRVVIRAIGP